jgi:hypothetical protein
LDILVDSTLTTAGTTFFTIGGEASAAWSFIGVSQLEYDRRIQSIGVAGRVADDAYPNCQRSSE